MASKMDFGTGALLPSTRNWKRRNRTETNVAGQAFQPDTTVVGLSGLSTVRLESLTNVGA